MKRFLATLLAVLMVLSFTACNPHTARTEPEDTHNHSHDHTRNEETTAPSAAQETNPTAQPAQNEEPQLSKGTISGNIYTSPFTQLMFIKPSDWTYLSDEELAEKLNISAQELAEDIFPYTAERVPAVYDMWATDEKNGINISVAYENMHISASVAMTTDQYMEMLEGAFANTKGTTLVQKTTVDLSSQMYQKAVFKTETDSGSTQSIYYLRAMGKFMNIVLVTAPEDTELPDINSMFG